MYDMHACVRRFEIADLRVYLWVSATVEDAFDHDPRIDTQLLNGSTLIRRVLLLPL